MARTTKDKTVMKPITIPGSIAEATQRKADKESRSFSNTASIMMERQLKKEGYLPAASKKE